MNSSIPYQEWHIQLLYIRLTFIVRSVRIRQPGRLCSGVPRPAEQNLRGGAPAYRSAWASSTKTILLRRRGDFSSRGGQELPRLGARGHPRDGGQLFLDLFDGRDGRVPGGRFGAVLVEIGGGVLDVVQTRVGVLVAAIPAEGRGG